MKKFGFIIPIIFIYFFTSSGCDKRETNAHSEKKIESGVTNNMDSLQIATFGSGCFWCTEAIFERVNGVVKVESGYLAGQLKIRLIRKYAPAQLVMQRLPKLLTIRLLFHLMNFLKFSGRPTIRQH